MKIKVFDFFVQHVLFFLNLLDSQFGETPQTNLNFQMNLLKLKTKKKHEKYFVAHQKVSKIFHDPSIYV